MEELENRYEELTAKSYTSIFAEIEITDKGKAVDGFAEDYDIVYKVVRVLKTAKTTEQDCE